MYWLTKQKARFFNANIGAKNAFICSGSHYILRSVIRIGKKLTLIILKYYLRFAPPNNDPKTPRMSCLPTSWPMLRAALLAADSNTP